MEDPTREHVPVLVDEVAQLLAVKPGDIILDCTVGLGGHARMLAEAAGESGLLIGMDVDESNLQSASQRLEGCACRVRLFRSNFARADEVLAEAQVGAVDVILADLGVSSAQLADKRRGLSFQEDAPLDMRLDDRLEQTAADLVNRLGEQELADLIYRYGQERFSRRIARAVVHARRNQRITTTQELVTVIARALRVDPRSRAAKIHPATRTFQALRIAVNDELGALERLLAQAPTMLRPGGRIGIISFHSLEDGIVKQDFRAHKSDEIYDVLTKKPLTARAEEIAVNPRSRSAKLRVAVRHEN
ncbi:MAG TPA: 16S rRNA (cytosine(1402)-N(4))-methyltransferase RsmH [Phycisphaerae bacterium]|nr:16S rRNA (cytosine(1402)-N(4))-methyltransferase RsmH [Phycisphaerae bacterium]